MQRFVVVVVALGALLAHATSARAQGQAKDQAGAVSAKVKDEGWLRKFAGSSAELALYVGTGTFYASGYRNPYVAGALYAKPTFNLGTPLQLTLNARTYLVEEFTQPDDPNGRRFYPFDLWFWINAGNLYTEKYSKIRLSGLMRLVVPTSPDSLYSNMVLGLAGGLSLARRFEWGKGKHWSAALNLGAVVTKQLHTAPWRGTGPGDTTGCRGAPALVATVSAARGDLPSVADSDRCGGPLNTSWFVVTSADLTLGWRKLSLSTLLIVINAWKYGFERDAFTPGPGVEVGQVDSTWGLATLSYDHNDHIGVSLGVSSFQPALDSLYRRPRFPFFDFESTATSNYTQIFVSVYGTL